MKRSIKRKKVRVNSLKTLVLRYKVYEQTNILTKQARSNLFYFLKFWLFFFLFFFLQIPVRPFRHNEYERFITTAFPYYGASFSMVIYLTEFERVLYFQIIHPKSCLLVKIFFYFNNSTQQQRLTNCRWRDFSFSALCTFTTSRNLEYCFDYEIIVGLYFLKSCSISGKMMKDF